MEQSVNRGLTTMKTRGGLGLDNLVNQYDFFDWMSGVFLPRFQDLQSGGNSAFGSGNFLIGAPRLSQTRVASDSCEWKRFFERELHAHHLAADTRGVLRRAHSGRC